MKFYDLFAGIGGFRLGMERAGHVCVGECENDQYARQIYAEHFGTAGWEDATNLEPWHIKDHDILCAGFPCPTFSVAGRRLGLKDKRGRLFFEIIRIARQKRPRYLLLENVKGLLSHDNGRTFAIFLSAMDELGYDAEWQVLNSKYWVPQNRERIFIIGYLRGTPRPKVFPLREIGEINDGTLQETQGERAWFRGKNTGAIDANYAKGGGSRTMIKVLHDAEHSTNRVYSTDGIARTLRATSGGLGSKTGVYAIPLKFHGRNQKNFPSDYAFTVDTLNTGGVDDGTRYRQLTPLECERLQGFPDGWTKNVSNRQRYKTLGNAVTVPVVEAIAISLPKA